ncbi:DUF4333 domain-containing protein [Tomitella cavernea]|uniref:DUF4333 domain-containing protein n=1 Tax=Tomitella cavernea TaxID=1387982 RepID=A0ABP9CRT3_9ACTN|nr:DUF4333 domain-containing protein [Tomitella cavernea]
MTDPQHQPHPGPEEHERPSFDPTQQFPQYPPAGPYPPMDGGTGSQAYSDYPQAGYPPQAYSQAGYAAYPYYDGQQQPPGSPWAPPGESQGGYPYAGYAGSGHQQVGYQQSGTMQTEPGPVAEARRPTGREWLIAGLSALAAAAAVAVLVLGFLWPGFFVTTVLDTQAAEASIADVLRDDLGIGGVDAVECPSDIAVADGGTFTCQAVVNGRVTTVSATFQGDDGVYVVSAPTR